MEPLRIDSKDEEEYFFNLIIRNYDMPIAYYHVGGFLVGDKWKWTSDLSDVYSNMKWSPGEPNNYGGNEKCLTIYRMHGTYDTGFNDMNCEDAAERFLCQKYTFPKIAQQSVRELDLERQLETQKGVCKLLNQALNTMLITSRHISFDAIDS